MSKHIISASQSLCAWGMAAQPWANSGASRQN